MRKMFHLVSHINANGMNAAAAVKPGTSHEKLFPLIEKLHMVLVMTVEPGKGGQSFMVDMMPKVATLRSLYPKLNIQVG